MARESLTSKALKEDPDFEEEEIIKYTATQLYAGEVFHVSCPQNLTLITPNNRRLGDGMSFVRLECLEIYRPPL